MDPERFYRSGERKCRFFLNVAWLRLRDRFQYMASFFLSPRRQDRKGLVSPSFFSLLGVLCVFARDQTRWRRMGIVATNRLLVTVDPCLASLFTPWTLKRMAVPVPPELSRHNAPFEGLPDASPSGGGDSLISHHPQHPQRLCGEIPIPGSCLVRVAVPARQGRRAAVLVKQPVKVPGTPTP